MNRNFLCHAIAATLILTACTTAPVREDAPQLRTTIANAGTGAPRLPKTGESYLDPDFFEQPLSVARAVQAAMLNNPIVRAELARLEVAQADRVQSGLLSNPIGSLMALRPGDGGRYELDYSLMQSLFDLFARSRRLAVADAAQRQVEAEVAMNLVSLAQGTEAAYYAALVAEEKLRLRREQQTLTEDELHLLQAQASHGAIPQSDAIEQQAVASMRAHNSRDAEAALAQARSQLAQQLGLSSAKGLRLPESLPAFAPPGLDESTLQTLAIAHRVELQATAAKIALARAEQRQQTGALRATQPALGPAGTRESGGLWLNGVAVQITLPIFDTGRARRDRANAQIAQAQFTAESARRQVPLDVERTLATLLASEQALDHADHHLHQQQLLERLARRTYEQGASDFSHYRLVSQARLASALDQLEAQQALWNALLALEKATGIAMVSD
jgi:cobalt-zinc-cadmium efflux system outer membrane protein